MIRAVISDFLCDDSQPTIDMAPDMPELRQECKLHEARLDEAVQNLQLKAAGNIDVGSLLRFLMAMGKWITAGTPTISGSVERGKAALNVTTAPDAKPGPDTNDSHGSSSGTDTVSIHLAARGIGVHTVSITTSSELHPGIDCIQLAAERAAFKFLIRMKYPQMTNDEVNGLAALRQGASLFSEFAGTVPGIGSAATTRISALKNAALNLAFFRSSIPIHSGAPDTSQYVGSVNTTRTTTARPGDRSVQDEEKSSQVAGIKICDELRQGVLLVEGVAHALTNEAVAQNSAISCFRQLQEWPGSRRTLPLRQQAAYNEAIAQQRTGYYAQCVLMLTELLGDVIPGADGLPPGTASQSGVKNDLPEAVCLTARIARLVSFAQYTREDWTTLPDERATLLINDAVNLVKDLEQVCVKPNLSLHDCRMAKYMHLEALRATGRVELRRAIQGTASRFYDPDTNRPTGLLTDALDEESPIDKAVIDNLQRSIQWMRECEEISPGCGLYCDIAESYLLLKRFPGAQAYGRHATLRASPSTNSPAEICADLGDDPDHERAFYLAAESYALAGNDSLAKKYAERFPGKVTLDEFKALRTKLGLTDQQTAAPAAQSPS
jgi:hypothetical protein